MMDSGYFIGNVSPRIVVVNFSRFEYRARGANTLNFITNYNTIFNMCFTVLQFTVLLLTNHNVKKST